MRDSLPQSRLANPTSDHDRNQPVLLQQLHDLPTSRRGRIAAAIRRAGWSSAIRVSPRRIRVSGRRRRCDESLRRTVQCDARTGNPGREWSRSPAARAAFCSVLICTCRLFSSTTTPGQTRSSSSFLLTIRSRRSTSATEHRMPLRPT